MICVSIGAATEAEMLGEIAKADKLADIIELRLDYLRNPVAADLRKLMRAGKKKKIATVRSKKEGGRFRGSEKARAELLKKAARAGAKYIDVEFSMPERLRNGVLRNRGKAKAILSSHNFKETPRLSRLIALYDRMRAVRSADAIKIVTSARKETDNLLIIGLLREAQKDRQKAIAFCMGEKGKISRMLALLDGSFLTYGSLSAGKETAKGQIPAKELRKLYRRLV